MAVTPSQESWSTPRTWATSDIVTRTMMDTDIRANMRFLYNVPRCLAYRNTNLSLTTATITSVTLPDGETTDNDSMHSLVTNSDRITLTRVGFYIVSGFALFAANATGERDLGIWDGTTFYSFLSRVPPATVSCGVTICQTIYCATAGTYLALCATQTSGGNLNVTNAALAVTWKGTT